MNYMLCFIEFLRIWIVIKFCFFNISSKMTLLCHYGGIIGDRTILSPILEKTM